MMEVPIYMIALKEHSGFYRELNLYEDALCLVSAILEYCGILKHLIECLNQIFFKLVGHVQQKYDFL